MTIETVPKRKTNTHQVFIGPCFVNSSMKSVYIMAGEAPTLVGALGDAISTLKEVIKRMEDLKEQEKRNAIRR